MVESWHLPRKTIVGLTEQHITQWEKVIHYAEAVVYFSEGTAADVTVCCCANAERSSQIMPKPTVA